MKATRAQIERALDSVDPAVRLFLVYGPDEAGARELAARLGKAMPGAERVDLSGPALKADPARLPDEAASMSLFGDRRFIRVEPAGDEMADAADALLSATEAGNPVVAVGGDLRKDSKLLKRALADARALAFACYQPEGAEADRLAMMLARAAGVRMAQDVAQRLSATAGGDRAILAREIEKFALFLDAAPDRPVELHHEALDALSAESQEGDVGDLVNATLNGDARMVDAVLARLDPAADAVTILRALTRRLLLLIRLRGEVARGNSVESVVAGAGRALFWKDRGVISGQLSRWPPAALARAADRIAAAERLAKSSGGALAARLGEELLAIARQARRAR